MSGPDPPVDRERSPGSRLLSRVDMWTSRPLAALIVLTADMAWVLVSVAAGFPSRWESIFQAMVAALTLAMVFVIQHTQAREQAAIQRKLDEILQALPGADNSLLELEHASDDDLRAARPHPRPTRYWIPASSEAFALLAPPRLDSRSGGNLASRGRHSKPAWKADRSNIAHEGERDNVGEAHG
jgi:low affinity Fe/Cu permease